MFRKFGLIAAIALTGLGLLVPAAAARPAPTPVCLITTSVQKQTVCAELLSRDTARAMFDTISSATLTVTLEYSSVLAPHAGFLVLASKTVSGSGPLDVTTDPVAVPATGSVQACASAVVGARTFHLCSSN